MKLKYSTPLTKIFEYSKEEAIRLESRQISIEHLFLGILRSKENDAYYYLISQDLDIPQIKNRVEEYIRLQKTDTEQTDKKLFAQTTEVVDLMHVVAEDFNEDEIQSIHLLFAILRLMNSKVAELLQRVGITAEQVYQYYDKVLEQEKSKEVSVFEEFDDLIAEDDDSDEDKAVSIRIDPEEFKDKFSLGLDKIVEKFQNPENQASANAPHQGHQPQMQPEPEMSILEEFGTDLVYEAAHGKLDKLIGREEELERLQHVLSKKRKNNAILIGEPGVGKTALVEGLAHKLALDDVPYYLINKRIISVDISSMVSGTRFRGEFEARMTKLVEEVSSHDDIILYFDEIHNLIGAGNPSGSLDAAGILKPALARGIIRCIGTTTFDEYREFFEDNQALERRFEKLYVEEPSKEETLKILQGAKHYYEKYHNVRFQEQALETAVLLSERYIPERKLPDKALNLLDEAGAKKTLLITESEAIKELSEKLSEVIAQKEEFVAYEEYEKASQKREEEIKLTQELEKMRTSQSKRISKKPFKISADQIKQTLSILTGIPINSLSLDKNSKILKLENKLKKEIKGQDAAVERLVKALKRNYAGLRNPEKPIGTFIFLGSTGVGKTQLAKSISNNLFDDDNALIRFDMSEFMDKASVSRLVGTSPGYIGYEEGGELTEKIKHNPYSVLLFDEIEKAHKDIFNILLQILDEGIITDGHGRTVSLKNTVIIMTSNIGVKKSIEFGKGIGFGSADASNANQIIEKELKKTFSPEFLNRVDDIVYFNALSEDTILEIIDLKLKKLLDRAQELGFDISVNKAAKQEILRQAYSATYGARPVERKIQELIENEISELIIHKKISKEDKIKIKHTSKGFEFETISR